MDGWMEGWMLGLMGGCVAGCLGDGGMDGWDKLMGVGWLHGNGWMNEGRYFCIYG